MMMMMIITPISKISMIITKTKEYIFKAYFPIPYFAWFTVFISFIEN
jgi:hypothetical protein